MTFNAVMAAIMSLPSMMTLASTGITTVHTKLIVDSSLHVDLQHGTRSFLGVSNVSGAFNAKPVRIFRRGRAGKGKDKFDRFVGSYGCEKTFVADASTNKYEHCSPECPYFVQDKADELHCTFRCVSAIQCVHYNPKTPIADDKKRVCRAPSVSHCRVYLMDGTDSCLECQRLFYLGLDGQCHYRFMWAMYVLLAVLVAVVIFLFYWITDMCLRPISNPKGRQQGLEMRSHQKLHQVVEGKSCLWPFSTNLLRENVAGPGLTLHFNFQFMVIIWALIISLGWTILALTYDYDLFTLGTRKFGSSFENCILVAWGYETQQRLMPQKVYFLVWAYSVTFICSLLHSIRQLRVFQVMDEENKTMKDFAALVTGMPKIKGDKRVEDDLKKAVADASGASKGAIVGVSVCWNYGQKDQDIIKAVLAEEAKLDPVTEKGNQDQEPPQTPRMNPPRKWLYNLEVALFEEKEEEESNAEMEKAAAANVTDMLVSLETSESAFVVFRTEAEKDAAVEKISKSGGFEYSGSKLQLEHLEHEPGTVQWQNFDNSSATTKAFRVCKGFGCILLGLLFWTTVFYAPYAWSVASFNYRNGQEPGFVYGFAFSMVVVVGNTIMYEICARASDLVGFRFRDEREACYMIMYTIACTFNIMLDLVTTFFMAFEIMKGLGFKTYFGERLDEVEGFNNRFETYAMQRSLAENTFSYAFPSTYLIPFLLEPLLTINLPYKFGELLVRSHPRIFGRQAEDWLAAGPMDMGRYADILLDVVLAILIFFFPGGYTAKLFLALAACHCWIYVFDHARVLRSIPSCTFATMQIDWWSQAMLAPCTAMTLSCLIFKANGQGFGFEIKGDWIVLACFIAFVVHITVHLLLLIYVVPMFKKKTGDKMDKLKDCTYADVNRSFALSWFSSNPVHCLRSKFIYEHKTFCHYFQTGREHLLQLNEEIGCYYKCDKPAPEDFENLADSIRKDTSDLLHSTRSLFKESKGL